jgi:tetratricopeptide (TPR) repeat protein
VYTMHPSVRRQPDRERIAMKAVVVLCLPLAAVVLGGASPLASGSSSKLTISGNSQARACSESATLVADRKMAPRFAVETCTEALEIEALTPYERARTFNNRGVVRMGMADEHTLAAGDFDQAAKTLPWMGESYLNRGTTLLRENKFTEAKAQFERSLELGIAEPWKAYYNRAVAYEGLNDARSAYRDYQKALELNPNWEAPAAQLTRFRVVRR